MFEIIPVLPVNEACAWCEPQQCYTASVWWGDVLINFYTKHAERLEPNDLNDEACEVLRQVTKGLCPDSDTIIAPEVLWPKLGNCGTLDCYWADYRPPVTMACASTCCIPEPAECLSNNTNLIEAGQP